MIEGLYRLSPHVDWRIGYGDGWGPRYLNRQLPLPFDPPLRYQPKPPR